MTEAEWLTCTDPHGMEDWLRPRLSERKLRLYACAGCRRVASLLQDVRAVRALEVAERHAEGKASATDLLAAHRWAEKATRAADWKSPAWSASNAVRVASKPRLHGWGTNPGAVAAALAAASAGSTADRDQVQERELAQLADLLREVAGNPFRPACLAPACLTPAVLALAAAAYDERLLPSGHLDPTHLAVLSDALEEAGCTHEAILGHLRSAGPHVRGCFAVDLLLGQS